MQHSKGSNTEAYLNSTLTDANPNFEDLVELNEAGIFCMENEIITYANAAFCKVLGINQKKIVGYSIYKKVVKEDQEKLKGIFGLMATGALTSISDNFRVFSKKGYLKYFSLHLKAISVQNKIVKIIGASRDSTERVLARQELVIREKKYKDIFENSHEAISYLDIKSGKIIDCNKNALKLYGAKTIDELKNLPKSNFHQNFFKNSSIAEYIIRDRIQVAINRGKASVTFEAVRLNGEEFIYEGVLIVDNTNLDSPKIITFARDITDIHYAEIERNKLIEDLIRAKEEINDRNIELEKYIESNLQLENFAYFASHDLKTPLRSIISFTQLMKRSLIGKINEQEQEYMDFIIAAGRNMQNLINDLLSYSLVNSSELKIEKINLPKLLEQLKKELSADIEKTNSNIIINQIPDYILADQTKIKQLFQNLFSNALKFISDTENPTIEIFSNEDDKYWQFSVKDNGIGIAQEYQDKIFLLFKRLHNATEYEGTGIGLALCKKVVDQHEGKIWFDSQVGEGTHFYFTIKKKLVA